MLYLFHNSIEAGCMPIRQTGDHTTQFCYLVQDNTVVVTYTTVISTLN